MDTQQPPPDRRDRPNTLGQAWNRMAEPRPRLRRPPDPHLPILPDWPPLPEEQSSLSAWPPRGPVGPNVLNAPGVPDESHPANAFQPTKRDEMLWSGRSWPPAASPVPAPVPTRAGPASLLGRFRRFGRSSKRARVSLAAAAAVMLVVLIVACSSLALHATAGLVTGGVAPGAHGAANQSSTALATVTAHPTSQPTPTSAPPPPLTLAITCASGQIRGTGRVCVHTLPGASLNLTVRYCDGSTARGLRSSATADTSGNYTWTWPVHLTCAGPATATVTATANGQSLTASDTFTVTG